MQNPPIILQDNARAQIVADVFDLWCWEVMYHPTYPPGLKPLGL